MFKQITDWLNIMVIFNVANGYKTTEISMMPPQMLYKQKKEDRQIANIDPVFLKTRNESEGQV